jgi:hypothetical protein
MPLSEELVAEVVAEVSQRMREASYGQIAIGSFAQSQPDAGRYITAHLDELGSGEAVMYTVFHAELVSECFRRHLGHEPKSLRFSDLDAAATSDQLGGLRAREPAIAEYIESNVDDEAMRRVLSLVALAMSRAAG